MILSIEGIQKEFKTIEPSIFSNIVFNHKHYERDEDVNALSRSIEVLDYINTIKWANKLHKDLGVKKEIKTGVIYKIMNLVMEGGVALNENEIKEYFAIEKEMSNFQSLIERFCHLDKHVPIPIQLMLFGMTYENAEKVLTTREPGIDCDKYFNLFCDFLFGGKKIETFLKEAKETVKEYENFLNGETV